jgi:SAM-dependent methyltransferase
MLVRVCGSGVIDFVRERLNRTEVEGRSVLEVGSLDVNGSVRPDVEALEPARYLGVDIAPGPRVDEICDVRHLVDRYGAESFDILVSTELLEHVRDWKRAITNMKRVLRPGGILVITTRSLGFPLHGYRWDYWRYEPEDFAVIFSDFDDVTIEQDPEAPGVFIKARKPLDRRPETPLDNIALHSVARNGRTAKLSMVDDLQLRLRFVRRRLRGESLT